jgi:cytoskeletal protein CcmA (bactofilin family)
VLGKSSIDMSATATAALLPELPGAIGSTGSISMKGNASVDSYDSSQGTYDPATAGQDGDIVADGTISLSGSSSIKGDVKGSTVTAQGNSQVSGSTAPSRRPLDFPSVDATEVALENDNDGLPTYTKGKQTISPLDGNRNFSLSGGIDYAIPPGNYYFNDLNLSGQSTLTVSGVTTIYLTGDLDTSGGDVINASQDPNNLRILMTGGTAVINASVDWYGLLYAPDTDVTINGTGEVFGAIIARDVDFGGTGDVHFDLNLTASDVIDGLTKRSAIVQ